MKAGQSGLGWLPPASFSSFGNPSSTDPLPPATTGSFPAVQFNASQKPFVADFSVPVAEFHFSEMPARYRSLKSPSDAHLFEAALAGKGSKLVDPENGTCWP